MNRVPALGVVALLGALAPAIPAAETTSSSPTNFVPLFPGDRLEGWQVSDWSDVAKPPKLAGAKWSLRDGVLEGRNTSTWIYSKRSYGDFVLRFEGKLTVGGNSGIGLRFPDEGDPAYRGMEIQFVDGEVYYHTGNWKGYRPEQLTGSIYDEIPAKQAMKPAGQWNAFEITCRKSQVTVVLNGHKVLDVDLSKETKARQKRGPALAQRPRNGHIGFQNLGGTVTFRHLAIAVMDNLDSKD